jgi:membrane protease YdiL (CAAX protease family)
MKERSFAVLQDDTVNERSTTSINWSPWLAVVFVVVVFFASQFIAAILLSVYPALQHWSSARTNDWLNNSITAQFFYVLMAEALVVVALYWFLKFRRSSWRAIGFRRPKWRDLGWGLLIVPLYYITYIIIAAVGAALIPELNSNQAQQLGFDNPHGMAQLTLTFISLVILPPLVEETLMRGYLYGSLRKNMSKIGAALVTSIIFASAHLEFGSGAPLLWIAALDTFVLSLFLVYLREKTGSLWAGMLVHALKNGIAFASLFIFHLT